MFSYQDPAAESIDLAKTDLLSTHRPSPAKRWAEAAQSAISYLLSSARFWR